MGNDGPLFLHPDMQQKVRAGDWRAQCESTYDLFARHVRAGDFDGAGELALYTIQEAEEPIDLYRRWLPQIRDFLRENAVGDAEVAADEAALVAAFAEADGTPFDPLPGWERTRRHADEAARHCAAGRADEAIASLEASRLAWLATHDRLCDWVQGLIAIVARRVGERAVGPLWQRLMSPMFEGYERYDIDATPWERSAERLLYVTAEALRGHLTGPGRRGTMEFVEEPDRIGFRFRPCGSGGRNFTGETIGRYPLTRERHDWAWNAEGVCLYCAHCCALSEINPIRRYGYPARVVEPPYANDSGTRQHCTWWVYRSPDRVPEDVYRRTGHQKPAALGGHATRGGPDRLTAAASDRETPDAS